MKTKHVPVIVEKSDEGFSAYVESLPGCVAFNKTIDGLKADIEEVVEFHLEGMREDNEKIPDLFNEEYQLEIHIDVAQFFEHFEGLINASAFAKRIKVNRSLFAQYLTGDKNPSEKRSMDILREVKKIGNEFAAVI